jgi:hypothetical protein
VTATTNPAARTTLRIVYEPCGTCWGQGRILEAAPHGCVHVYPCSHCDGAGRRPVLLTRAPRRGWAAWRASRAWTHQARRGQR